jgi:hypothetical protein
MNQPIQFDGAAAIIPRFLHQLDRRLHFGLAEKGRYVGAERLVSRHGGVESLQECAGIALAQRRRHGRKKIPHLLRGIGPEAGRKRNQEQRATSHFKSCSWR